MANCVMEPGVCRGCGCTDDEACFDEATGGACYWIDPECTLCSRCARHGHAIAEESQEVQVYSERDADLFLEERRRYGV